MVTTLKFLPPFTVCRFDKLGISSRHGAHQVAQKLIKVRLPEKDFRMRGSLLKV